MAFFVRHPHRLLILLPFIGVVTWAAVAYRVVADAPEDYGTKYELRVTSANENLLISRGKALEVLLNYFPNVEPKWGLNKPFRFSDVPETAEFYPSVKRACELKLFNCSVERFYPNRPISRADFLEIFFKFKYFDDPEYLERTYPNASNNAVRSWIEGRRLNFPGGEEITYGWVREIMYRNEVSDYYGGLPYDISLAIRDYGITAENYHNLAEIDSIREMLKRNIALLDDGQNPTYRDQVILAELTMKYAEFERLYRRLLRQPYLLTRRSDLSEAVQKAIKDYSLQDVIVSHTYFYGDNPDYRQHNLLTGTFKMHEKVLMPDEVMDFWSWLMDKNLDDFKYGWVIAQGKEEWQFGGGICGSSTMAFIPTWKAGFEIVERQNHSKYYSNLYPMENIGLDATVYRPKPNLRMRNTLGTPVVFNVTDDKETQTVTVEIIGNSPYRTARLEGPVYLNRNKVKWVRHYEKYDGSITEEALESFYNVIYR